MSNVVLCRPGDSRLGLHWESFDPTGGFEQSADGPVMLVITEQTSDEKCARLAERFKVAASRLIEFRDAQGDGAGQHGR